MQSDPTVYGGPDDRPPVCSFKVAPHDLVEASVTEDQRLEFEASRSQQVNGLLVLVGKPEGVVVPPELQPLKARAVLPDGINQVVDVDLDRHSVPAAHHQDPGLFEFRQCRVPKLVSDVGHPGQGKACHKQDTFGGDTYTNFIRHLYTTQ